LEATPKEISRTVKEKKLKETWIQKQVTNFTKVLNDTIKDSKAMLHLHSLVECVPCFPATMFQSPTLHAFKVRNNLNFLT